MSHLVLLGDSILDNGAYVPRGQSVSGHLARRLPGWQVTPAAVDGATVAGVARQAIPSGATHLLVSAGGNDALGQAGLLDQPVGSLGDGLSLLADLRERFDAVYGQMLDGLGRTGLPVTVCTIYDTRYGDRRRQRQVVAALAVFNDVITRHAFARRLSLLDLRLVCDRDEDFSNQIEPSASGGDKIAAAVATLLSSTGGSRVIGR